MALGLTQQLPVDEKHNYSRNYLNDQIGLLLGGRIAEELTTGNMSDAMGPLTFGKKEEQIFLGREIAQHTDYSEDTALRIDAEVKRIVMDAYSRSTEILTKHKKELLEISDALLAREVLDAEQVMKLARGEKLEDSTTVAPRPPADEGTRDRARDQRPPLVPPIPKPLTQE
jgi:cell division protease FtsH